MKHNTGLLKNELCLGMYASCSGPLLGMSVQKSHEKNVQNMGRHMHICVSRHFDVIIIHKGSAKIQARLPSYFRLPFQ